MLRQIRKTTENHALEVAKNVWKSIPHLMQRAARNPEERVQLNKLEHFKILLAYLQKMFKQLITEKRKANEDED